MTNFLQRALNSIAAARSSFCAGQMQTCEAELAKASRWAKLGALPQADWQQIREWAKEIGLFEYDDAWDAHEKAARSQIERHAAGRALAA